MYTTSNVYKNTIKKLAREWDIYVDVTLASGRTLKWTKQNLVLGSFIFKDGATCSSTIQVGSTYSNSVEFQVLNKENEYTDYDFTGAKVQPYVGLSIGSTFEYVPLGDFYILEPLKKFTTISVTALDYMSRCNKTFDFSTIQFPTTPLVIFDEVMAQCDITYTTALRTQVEALTYEINSLLTNEPSCRDILAGFGVMLCRNLRFNRKGVLESFWYTSVNAPTDTHTRVGNSSYSDALVRPTGVYLSDTYGNTFSVGTEEYAVELPTSPILQGSDMCVPLLETILEVFQSMSYYASKIEWIGDPSIQAGDIISHTGTAVGNISLPVMLSVYKFAGTCTLESLGIDKVTGSQQSATAKKLRQIFNKTNTDRAELESKIVQSADAVLTQVSEKYADKESVANVKVTADSVQTTVTQQSNELDILKEEVSRIDQDAQSIDLRIKTIEDDGVNKVTNEFGLTIDKSDVTIHREGSDMTNSLNETGMYVVRNKNQSNEQVMLEANADGVKATDVTVNNYLSIGHARFEEYTRGSDTKRTACFWV